ncbi:MAG TPA: thioredoxin domain-containing protein [Bryobacteraceae bacterium]|nr:thioredoxin domain-containing protein [Bryobacteraceae bacterium]
MKLPVYFLLAVLPALASAAEVDRAKAFGNPSAPLQIELFSDFQCPSCRALHLDQLPFIMRDYVNTGKAYLIYKEFPLPMHPHAREAAAYACASARIGKYDKVADVLFQSQPSWAENGKVYETVASVLSPADRKKVQALAKDPSVLGEIERDVQEGQQERINQTPTLLVIRNGRKYPIGGMLNYDLLRRFLDDLISK